MIKIEITGNVEEVRKELLTLVGGGAPHSFVWKKFDKNLEEARERRAAEPETADIRKLDADEIAVIEAKITAEKAAEKPKATKAKTKPKAEPEVIEATATEVVTDKAGEPELPLETKTETKPVTVEQVRKLAIDLTPVLGEKVSHVIAEVLNGVGVQKLSELNADQLAALHVKLTAMAKQEA